MLIFIKVNIFVGAKSRRLFKINNYFMHQRREVQRCLIKSEKKLLLRMQKMY